MTWLFINSLPSNYRRNLSQIVPHKLSIPNEHASRWWFIRPCVILGVASSDMYDFPPSTQYEFLNLHMIKNVFIVNSFFLLFIKPTIARIQISLNCHNEKSWCDCTRVNSIWCVNFTKWKFCEMMRSDSFVRYLFQLDWSCQLYRSVLCHTLVAFVREYVCIISAPHARMTQRSCYFLLLWRRWLEAIDTQIVSQFISCLVDWHMPCQ